jgi:hypothetical protein
MPTNEQLMTKTSDIYKFKYHDCTDCSLDKLYVIEVEMQRTRIFYMKQKNRDTPAIWENSTVALHFEKYIIYGILYTYIPNPMQV